MSIANYSDLTGAVANWLVRSDLTARIPEGIVLCEAKMNRFLRTRDMETKNAAFSIASEFVSVPTNFAEVRNFYRNDSPNTPIVFMPDDEITALYGGISGAPRYFNVQGANFRFGPPPDGTYTATLTYLLRVPALTSGAPTNWVITAHPDAYLYGTQAEMCGILKDYTAQDRWDQKFYDVMEEIQADANRGKWGGNGMAVRSDVRPV